jgi:hypothetical protein
MVMLITPAYVNDDHVGYSWQSFYLIPYRNYFVKKTSIISSRHLYSNCDWHGTFGSALAHGHNATLHSMCIKMGPMMVVLEQRTDRPKAKGRHHANAKPRPISRSIQVATLEIEIQT